MSLRKSRVKFCLHPAVNICLLLFIVSSVTASPPFKPNLQQRTRQVEAAPLPEATVVISEQLVNSLLDGMLTLGQPPGISLARGAGGNSTTAEKNETGRRVEACDNRVVLAREIDGVRTAVRFAQGRIRAPLAFRGTYEAALVGCLRFQGSAMTDIELAFDREGQRLVARLSVQDVRLKDAPQLLSSLLTTIVRDAVNARFNPVEVLRAEQLAARLPQAVAGAGLKLRAREIRTEITAGELRLGIFYELIR